MKQMGMDTHPYTIENVNGMFDKVLGKYFNNTRQKQEFYEKKNRTKSE